VFCSALPSSWTNPTITLQGSASNNPTVTISGSLSFPAATCGGAVPPGQQIVIQNSASSAVSYTAQLELGTYYTITGASGSVPGNGSTPITVTPNSSATTPSSTLEPGSAAFGDRLQVTVGGAVYYEPISMTLNGAILNFVGGGPYTVVYNHGSVLESSNITLEDTGNIATTATATFAGSATPSDWGTIPTTQNVPANSGNNAGVTYSLTYSGARSCFGTLETGTISFTAPNLCQPFTATQVVRGCTY
jgi:hypothetical protein